MKLVAHSGVSTALMLSFAVVSLTPACTTRPYSSPQEQAENACRVFGPKTLSGAAIGGLGGAAAGAALGAASGGGRGAAIGAGVGALAGLIGGLAVGHSLDARDCNEARQALAQVRYTPIGQPVVWRSPTGNAGSFTPITAEYEEPNHTICRKLNQEVAVRGQQPTNNAVVTCRTPDGDYETVQELQRVRQVGVL